MAFAHGSGLDDDDEDDYSDAHTITPPPTSHDLPVTVTSQDTVGYDYNNYPTAGAVDARGKPTYISIPFSNNPYFVGPQQPSQMYQQQLLQQQYAQSMTQALNSQYLQQPSQTQAYTYPGAQYEYQQPQQTTPVVSNSSPTKESTVEAEQEVQTERTVYYNPTQSPNNSTVRPKLTVQIPLDEQNESANGDKVKEEKTEKKEAGNSKDQQPATSQALPTTTATTTTAGLLTSTWGTQMLPPPSPSTFLVSSTSAGPTNPFARSLLSASIANAGGSDMLPSPSNFYNTDWPSFTTQPTTTSASTSTLGPLSASTTLGPSSTLSTTASFSNLRSQLSLDMFPSPLQFNTPVVMASTTNSFMDSSSASAAACGDKRDAGYACGGSGMESVKRIKLEGRC